MMAVSASGVAQGQRAKDDVRGDASVEETVVETVFSFECNARLCDCAWASIWLFAYFFSS